MTTTEVGRRHVEESLSHHGVKGMHWGVRKTQLRTARETVSDKTRNRGAKELRTGTTKKDFKDARKDAKWLKKGQGIQLQGTTGQRLVTALTGVDVRTKHLMSKTERKIFNTSKKTIQPDVKELNKKPQYSGFEAKAKLLNPHSELHQQHEAEHTKLFIKHMKAAAEKHGTVSPSGKWEDQLHISKDGTWSLGIKRSGAKHGAMDDMDYVCQVKPIRNGNGHIVDHEPADGTMTQSAIGEQFVLSHFGVKGMHWGVRRAEAVTTQTHIDTGLVKRQTKVVATGGHAHPAHEDAIKAEVQEQKLKKSGHAALSNKELRDLITRRQLEDQASAATSTKGRKFARKQLEIKGQQQVQKGLGGVGATASNQAWKAAAKVAFA